MYRLPLKPNPSGKFERPLKGVIAIARKMLKDTCKTIAIFGTVEEGSGKLIIARTGDVELDMREVIKTPAELLGGGFGGKPDFAQAGGKNGDKLKEAMEAARKEIKKGIDKSNTKD